MKPNIIKPDTIKLITFDLDHTLWNPDAALQRAEAASYQWLAQQYPRFSDTFSYEQFFAWRVDVRDQHPHLRFRVSDVRRIATQQALQQIGVGEKEAAAAAKKAFDIFWQHRQNVDIFDGTQALLEALFPRYALGAISNGNACLKTIGLAHFFQFHFAADDFPQGKPEPDMFMAALQKAGIAPQQMLHIGDHPQDDIQGAKNVGIHTLWVNLTQEPWPATAQKPDITVTTLVQISELLLL